MLLTINTSHMESNTAIVTHWERGPANGPAAWRNRKQRCDNLSDAVWKLRHCGSEAEHIVKADNLQDDIEAFRAECVAQLALMNTDEHREWMRTCIQNCDTLLAGL